MLGLQVVEVVQFHQKFEKVVLVIWLSVLFNFLYLPETLESCEEGASLALVGHPSSDGVTIKTLYGARYFVT